MDSVESVDKETRETTNAIKRNCIGIKGDLLSWENKKIYRTEIN